MKKFNESFYTNDFDQEMLNFIKDNLNVTADGNLSTENMYLKYGKNDKCFWTHDNAPMSQLCFVYLTKNQFKEKIGMTNESQPEKQEGIFKLIDKEGYSARSDANKEFLEDYGILVDGFYYYKGRVDAEGDLMEVNDDWCLIDSLSEEFQYFEEVDSIPLPEDKPLLENYFVEPNEMSEKQSNTFTKQDLKSGEHVVKLDDGNYMILLGKRLVDNYGWLNLSNFNENLEDDENCIHVESVYEMTEYFTLRDFSDPEDLTLIWQRESPEEAEKRIRKQELEEEIQTLKEQLKIAENALEGL